MKYKFKIDDEVAIIPPVGSCEELDIGYILDKRMSAGKPEYDVEWCYCQFTWEYECDLQYSILEDERTYCDFQERIKERLGLCYNVVCRR